MDKEKLLQIGIDFREGKRLEKTWEDLNNHQGNPFKSGESYRCFVKKELKKIGKLPTKQEVISSETEDMKKTIDEKKKELQQLEKEYNHMEKEISKMESKEERRLKVIEKGDFYTISSNKRDIKVSKDKVKLIKQLYCDENGLSVNELCRKVDIPRRDFMLVKYAFDITHDDVPYLDEELDDIDEIVEESIERKKQKYFLKLQEKEIESMKLELKKYRDKDYLYNKILEGINNIEIKPRNFNVNLKNINSKREALLDLMDIHFGIKSTNYWNKYDVEEAKNRFKKLTEEVIKRCKDNNVGILHISSLGDAICGIIHETLRYEAEIDVEKQIELVTEEILTMLFEFSNVFEKVIYADVAGNHGRMVANKNNSIDEENFENTIAWAIRRIIKASHPKYDNIEFEENYIDDNIIVKRIAGVLIFETHGDKEKINKVASNLTMMIEKPSEIHLGHLHSNKQLEEHCVEVFVGRSFSGVDTYAKNLRVTSKAGQRLFIYENGQRLYISDIVLN